MKCLDCDSTSNYMYMYMHDYNPIFSHCLLCCIGSASRGRKHPLPMRDSVEFPVTLFRGSRGFGFSIRGGQEFNRMPLVVLRIADGGAAQIDGHLKVHSNFFGKNIVFEYGLL
ncbi:uncharacterized protein DC041_0012762 [Schistosoma bovis]|uniref:PDZ domain-containing protein n=1 Tax=Schistosoma bovis TaxID=6184 RepID=A0A430QT28_SCHBO|nr:uncharacterized protein DC041_0012762 [Schistosoma bovis]